MIAKVSGKCLWVFPFVAVFGLVGPLFGQTTAEDAPSLRSIMGGNSASNQGVQDQLDALIKTTQEARLERQSALEQSPQPGRPSDWIPGTGSGTGSGTGGGDRDVTNDAPGQAAGRSTRSLSEIRERIRILQRLRRDRMMAAPTEQASGIPGGTAAPTLSVPDGDVLQSNPVRLPGSAENSSQAMSSIDDSLDSAAPVKEAAEEATAETEVAAERILPNPVNAMALGESLYRTGNYESALKAFRSVSVDGLSQSDRTWLDLLIALCQRKLGQFEKAQGTLREIANEESTDYPVKAAQWWLKYSEASDGTQVKFSRVSTDFDALLERSEKYVSP
ncbi:Anaphase-promoting complex, cyclosome, subunit 3 [Stieleria neptunia]|uniref:Anaphase-promoting complex, cyclosome, subunit 3 n=1 Tax=Stieleria neptunia TaxID=2527979 RepID=A0A518HTZ6_9BACT|nr:Anaphase-promoting complex, cyclosome, subunit 3 [Stieleria neptunia]